MNANRDQVYEYFRHLDFQSIRNLCSSNRYYRNLCNTDLFRQLVRKKFQEMIIKQQEDRQLGLKRGDYFTYDIDQDYHDLNIQKNTETTFYLLEHIRSYADAILFDLFKQEAKSKMSFDEYIAFLSEVQKYGNRDFIINGSRYNFITFLDTVAIRIYDASQEQVRKVISAIFKRGYPTIIFRTPNSDVKTPINYPQPN